MDAFDHLAQAGEVSPPEQTTVDTAAEQVRQAAHHETNPPGIRPSPAVPRRRRRMWAGSGLTAAAAVAALLAFTLLPSGGNQQKPAPSAGQPQASGPTGQPHAAGSGLSAQRVRLIAQASQRATSSGTAIMTSSSTPVGNVDVPASAQAPSTIAVRFSGQDVNFTITSDDRGAAGVQNRIVNGEVYRYMHGRDGTMRWFHDTAPEAAASLAFPDPRALLRALRPAAHFRNVGTVTRDGIRLTHLRATTPNNLDDLTIPQISGTVTSLELWVDADNVVHRLKATASPGHTEICTIDPGYTPSAPPSPSNHRSVPLTELPDSAFDCEQARRSSALDITFASLGTPQTITAPGHATTIHSNG